MKKMIIISLIYSSSALSYANIFSFDNEYYKVNGETLEKISSESNSASNLLKVKAKEYDFKSIKRVQCACNKLRANDATFNVWFENLIISELLDAADNDTESLINKIISNNGGEFKMEDELTTEVKKILSFSSQEKNILKDIQQSMASDIKSLDKTVEDAITHYQSLAKISKRQAEESIKVMNAITTCPIVDISLGILGEPSFTLDQTKSMINYVHRKNIKNVIDALESAKREIKSK